MARPGNRALYPSLADITDVRADGDLQLVVDLARPSAFLPEEPRFGAAHLAPALPASSVLEPDVARAFPTAAAVNQALRMLVDVAEKATAESDDR